VVDDRGPEVKDRSLLISLGQLNITMFLRNQRNHIKSIMQKLFTLYLKYTQIARLNCSLLLAVINSQILSVFLNLLILLSIN